MISKGRSKSLPLLPATLLAAFLLRLTLCLAGAVPFESDEAIVGLMARHILQGARPAFFYGQAYMGSLDAWLIAGVSVLADPSVWAIRAVQIALYLGHVALTYLLAKRWSGDEATALLSALLTAVPPVLMTLYTTVSLGGYGETLVFGDLLLLLGWKLATDRKSQLRWWALWGAVAGLAFWTLGLIVIYLLPVSVLLLWQHRQRAWRGYLVAAAGFMVGSTPWWGYNLTHGWDGLTALYDPKGPLDPLAPVLPMELRLLGLLAIGLPGLIGIRQPWAIEWVLPPAIPVVLALYSVVIWRSVRTKGRWAWGKAYYLLWGICLAFTVMFVFSRFGSDPTGRYFLPLYTPLILFTASTLAALGQRARLLAILLTLFVLLYNLWGTWLAASSAEGLTPQYNPQLQYGNRYDSALISFLEQQGATKGYTHYWIAFKIAFLSEERVTLAPLLPHKSSLWVVSGDNRYPAYTEGVRRAEDAVYITGNQRELDAVLRQRFEERGIQYREQAIGPYHVFYDLAANIAPAELDPRWR